MWNISYQYPDDLYRSHHTDSSTDTNQDIKKENQPQIKDMESSRCIPESNDIVSPHNITLNTKRRVSSSSTNSTTTTRASIALSSTSEKYPTMKDVDPWHSPAKRALDDNFLIPSKAKLIHSKRSRCMSSSSLFLDPTDMEFPVIQFTRKKHKGNQSQFDSEDENDEENETTCLSDNDQTIDSDTFNTDNENFDAKKDSIYEANQTRSRRIELFKRSDTLNPDLPGKDKDTSSIDNPSNSCQDFLNLNRSKSVPRQPSFASLTFFNKPHGQERILSTYSNLITSPTKPQGSLTPTKSEGSNTSLEFPQFNASESLKSNNTSFSQTSQTFSKAKIDYKKTDLKSAESSQFSIELASLADKPSSTLKTWHSTIDTNETLHNETDISQSQLNMSSTGRSSILLNDEKHRFNHSEVKQVSTAESYAKSFVPKQSNNCVIALDVDDDLLSNSDDCYSPSNLEEEENATKQQYKKSILSTISPLKESKNSFNDLNIALAKIKVG